MARFVPRRLTTAGRLIPDCAEVRTQHPDVLRRVSALHVCPYGRPFQSPIKGQLDPMYM